MAKHEEPMKSRVIKIESRKSWDFFTTQAPHVVVHFTASWCFPSLAMNPVFEELALTHQDFLFLLVDVDDVKEVSTKMEVRAMPTFIMMKGGSKVDKIVGANSQELRKRIQGFVHSTFASKAIVSS